MAQPLKHPQSESECQRTASDGGVAVACSTHADRRSQKNGLPMMTACVVLRRSSTQQISAVLWSRDHGLVCTRVHFVQVSVSVSRQLAWCLYACSTITVICSTFKRVLCRQLELMQPVMWSRIWGCDCWVSSWESIYFSPFTVAHCTFLNYNKMADREDS